MNRIELEALKPGPGLVLASIPETVEAVKGIEAAHAVLLKTFDEVVEANEARRRRQELNISVPDCEMVAWRHWMATALRKFHEVRAAAAGSVLSIANAAIQAESLDIREREKGVANWLASIGGSDFAVLVMRLTGGLPPNEKLREARNFWRAVFEQSRRACGELPPAPVPGPTATDYANELKTMIKEKEG